MLGSLLGLLAFALVAAFFVWLVTRAWRARRPVLRWLGVVPAALFALLFTALTVLAAIGLYRLQAPHTNPVAVVQVAGTPEQIARGERFASGCADCHSSTGKLPLDGSKDNFLAGGPPLGVMYAPNLTPGGPLKDWSDGEVLRALREGIHKDGHALVIMPSMAFHNLSDADAQGLVAYLRSQPAVAHDLPDRNLNVLAAVLFGTGMFPTAAQPAITQPVVAPPPGVTSAYGQYLVSIAGCADCHGPDLGGSKGGGFGPPASPNLRLIVPQWQEDAFLALMHTGADPGGRQVGDEMPWKAFGKMFTDDELRAMYTYLHGLPSMVSVPE